jgi:hypothetical protein
MSEGLSEEVLVSCQAPASLRRVIGRCLDTVDVLLADAAALPGQMTNRGLAMEAAVILRLARRLSARLRRGDPLAARVALSKIDFLSCGLRGVSMVLSRRLFGSQAVSNPKMAARHD